MVILPAMKYDAETWTLTKSQEIKLAVAQRSMERSMLNVTLRDKIRNEEIKKRTKIIDIVERVEGMRGKWARYVARMEGSKWANRVTKWTPRQGKRFRGRPRRRWRDEIEKKAGKMWMKRAQDRGAWRVLWRLSASSCMKS